VLRRNMQAGAQTASILALASFLTNSRGRLHKENTMNTKTEQNPAAGVSTNTLMALSQVAFSGIEKMAALNLSVARNALENGFAASNKLMQTRDATALKELQASIGAPATEQCAAYFRSAQEIAGDSQQQIAELTKSYFATLGFDTTAKGGSNAGFDMFSAFASQTNSMFEASAKSVGDMTNKMMTPVPPLPAKTA
jgi:phasin family protein